MFPLSRLPLPKLFSTRTAWLEQQQTSILSAALIITLANVVSSISGLIRQRLLISAFFNTQTSREAFEALLVAFQIPDTMFQLIVLGALSAAFIPVFSSLKKRDAEQAFMMSSIVMNIMVITFLIASVLVAIFAEPITQWRTGEAFTPEQITIVTNLTRIMLVAQVFFAISNLLSAVLQSYQRFILPSIAPILYNIGIVIGVYTLEPILGIYSAGFGVCLGAFLHMVIQLPLAYKLGFRFRWSLNHTFPGVRELLKLIPARVLTIGITEVQNLSLGFFATSLGNLSFVVIRLALTLMALPIRIFGVPISQASLPFLSEQSEERDRQKFRDLVLQSLNHISFFALPASVLLLVLRIPIVRLLFGTSNFPWSTTLDTGRAVAIISLSVAAQAMAQLLIRGFHALKDTRTPLYVTIAAVGSYLLGSAYVVFFTDWEVLGLALITSLSAFLELGLFLVLFHNKIGNILTSTLWVPQLKMIAASFFMAVFLYLPFRIFDELIFNTTKTVELIGLTVTTGTIGMLVYIYFAALLEIRELQLVTTMLRSLNKWRSNLIRTNEFLVDTTMDDNPL